MTRPNYEYGDRPIRVIPDPLATRVGSWWRRRWHFDVTGGGRQFRLPPPIGEANDLQVLAACWWESDTQLVLELHTRNEKLSGDELTYVSVVAAWLGVCFPESEIIVNGVREHPILKTSSLSPDIVSYLHVLGY